MKTLINYVYNFFNKTDQDPHLGKIVMKYTSHGCMGEIEEFDFMGIIDSVIGLNAHDNLNYYNVKILKDRTGYELSDDPQDVKHRSVPSWYLRELSGGVYKVVD